MTHAPLARAALERIDGVLLLDKPRGGTSNRALQQARRLLNAAKAGHTGNLDPIATGLLVLCFGEATKLSRFLLDTDKRYAATFRLGVTTSTLDADGETVRVRPVSADRAAVERALAQFRGEIDQIPPMYSALKRDGRALYELARSGVEVERAPRRVVVQELVLRSFDLDRVDVEIACSKGTYVRSLAHDFGEVLGCGAHVVELRRLAVGALSVRDAITLEQLAALEMHVRLQRVLPADEVLGVIPNVHLTSLATHYLLRGQAVSVQHSHAPGWVRLYDAEQRFLGMGQILDDGRVAPRRLLAHKL